MRMEHGCSNLNSGMGHTWAGRSTQRPAGRPHSDTPSSQSAHVQHDLMEAFRFICKQERTILGYVDPFNEASSGRSTTQRSGTRAMWSSLVRHVVPVWYASQGYIEMCALGRSIRVYL